MDKLERIKELENELGQLKKDIEGALFWWPAKGEPYDFVTAHGRAYKSLGTALTRDEGDYNLFPVGQGAKANKYLIVATAVVKACLQVNPECAVGEGVWSPKYTVDKWVCSMSLPNYTLAGTSTSELCDMACDILNNEGVHYE